MRRRWFADGIKLRYILFCQVSAAVVLTAVTGSYFLWKENQTVLTDSYLDSNEQYAKKLSSNLNDLLGSMFATLEDIESRNSHGQLGKSELDLLYHGGRDLFHSIFVVDRNFQIIKATPESVKVHIGITKYEEYESLEKVMARRSLHGPVMAFDEHYVMLLTVPSFNKFGEFTGFVAGVIYLEESNALSRLLNEHFYDNGSMLYVADSQGHLVIHPDQEMIGRSSIGNAAVGKGLMGRSGSQKAVDADGGEYMAGYAYEPASGWVIVSQTPTAVLSAPSKDLFIRGLINILPIFLLIWFATGSISLLISRPLHRLALFASKNASGEIPDADRLPSAKSRIYVVKQLYQSLNRQLQHWNHEVQMDGLTGLANRRTFDATIQAWLEQNISFALILTDIDHFKEINDTHGHVIGDRVLQVVARQLQLITREHDLSFRYGGEEFGILLQGASIADAFSIAERLRLRISLAASPSGYPVTASFGVAHSDNRLQAAADVQSAARELVELADKALYSSKKNGRNRTSVG